MKKLLALATIGLLAVGTATSAHAEDVDQYPEIPDACIVELLLPSGPARDAHAPAGDVADLPDCADIDVCLLFNTLLSPGDDDAGPARSPHVESAEDCGEDVPQECIFDLRLLGPGRAVHPMNVEPTPTPEITPEPTVEPPRGKPFLVSQECQEQLSLALAPVPGGPVVGSNSTPTILMASALVLTGGLLLVGQRRLARR